MFKHSIFLLLVVLALSACNSEPTDPKPVGEGFDKEAMLKNIGEQVIIPAYQALELELIALQESIANYKADPSTAGMIAMRDQYEQSIQLWQACSTFEIGPAADVSLRKLVNTFPTDTGRINLNLEEGNYDLNIAQNAGAKGFPAIEFILYTNDDQGISDDELNYLEANADLLYDQINQVLTAWNGSYLSEFTSNDGSDVGSSVGMLVNEMVYDFELLKNARIGIPLGTKTLGIAQPHMVETPFAQISKELALAQLRSIKVVFNGGEKSGFDNYLVALGARYESKHLTDVILEAFDVAEASIEQIQGNLKTAVTESPEKVEQAHQDLQNLIVLLKTDMPSQLGIQITFQDNDGD